MKTRHVACSNKASHEETEDTVVCAIIVHIRKQAGGLKLEEFGRWAVQSHACTNPQGPDTRHSPALEMIERT